MTSWPARAIVLMAIAVGFFLLGGVLMYASHDNFALHSISLGSIMASLYFAAQARNVRRAAAGIVAPAPGRSAVRPWLIWTCVLLVVATTLDICCLFLFANAQIGVFLLYAFVGLSLALAVFVGWLAALWARSWFQN